ncbi:sodium- and chloride-dependent glycine transporter 1-like [Mizuhopecten yessoensis]|nr:sodium- and chloride-dependent glycine transporter 1-like [Mizuhopecten yessoensis]
MDQFPTLRRRRVLVQGVGCILWYFLGLILCTQGGIYVFVVLDWYIAFGVPMLAFIECVIIGWIYGAERFSRDAELMLGRGIPVLMRIALTFIAPSILLTIAVSTVATYKPPTYGKYKFPYYITIFGFLLGLSTLVPVIVGAVKAIRSSQGKTFLKRVVNASKPSENWKPASRKHARDYTYDELSNYKSFYSRMKLNIFGPGNTEKWI